MFKGTTIKGIGILFLCTALLLIGCSVSEESRAITAEELALANEAFTPIVTLDGVEMINPLTHFLTSYYDTPEEMDSEAFLRYFTTSNMADDGEVTAEEYTALGEAFGGGYTEYTLAEFPLPIHRIPRLEVDLVLEQYMGIEVWDLDTEKLCYLPDYDAFYNNTSDAGFAFVLFTKGEVTGDRIYLETETTILTLEAVEDGYRFISYQQL